MIPETESKACISYRCRWLLALVMIGFTFILGGGGLSLAIRTTTTFIIGGFLAFTGGVFIVVGFALYNLM